MYPVLKIALATAAIAFASVPANAAVNIFQCGVNAPSGSSCISDTSNVTLTSATGVGGPTQAPGVGTIVPSGPGLEITTTETAGLNIEASGQATITAADGVLNNITFTLLTGNITQAEFNLIDIGNADFDVLIETLLDGVSIFTSQTFTATFNGSNRFGITTDDGSVINSFTINSAAGFGALTQLRLNGADISAPVPEPGTWAMMLLGFGGMGVALRRRRKMTTIAQLA